MAIKNTARTVWTGSAKKGMGRVSTGRGVLSDVKITFNQRFGEDPGTNPEELVAAAHASCFAMALSFALEQQDIEAEKLDVQATVTLEQQQSGFAITRSALKLDADVPGVDRATFEKIAMGAKENCPVSKLLNAEVTLDWQLAGS